MTDSRSEFLAKRQQYWNAIHAMRPEYMQDVQGQYVQRPSVHQWALDKYGFQMAVDELTGGYTAEFTVVDPKKFMLFQIKYWQ